MTTRTPTTRTTLIAVFLAALAVRAGFCFIAIPLFDLNFGPNRGDFFTSTDGYIDLAINLVEHGTYAFAPDAAPTAYRAPMYPAALAVVYALIGDPVTVILLVNCLASAGTCVVVFLIARRLFGSRVTWAWAAPIVWFPLSIYYCANSLSDTFLTFTVVLYIWALVALLQSPSAKSTMGTAAAFAAAALTKAVVLPIPLIIIGYCAARRRAALPHAGIAACAGFVLVGAWTLRNYQATGAFVPVTGGAGFNTLLGNFMIDRGGNCDASLKYARRAAAEHLQAQHGIAIDFGALDTNGYLDVPRDIDKAYGRAAVAMYRNDPLLLVRKIGVNAARFWYFSSSSTKSLANGVVNGAVLLLAVAGLWRLRREERTGAELVALFALGYMLLYAIVIVHSARFSLPIVMVLLPAATAPIAALWGRRTGKRIAASRLNQVCESSGSNAPGEREATPSAVVVAGGDT